MDFKGGTTKNLKEEFSERKKYKELATSGYSSFMIDTWYQYPNYGFFNSDYEVVVPVAGENYENLSEFGEYAPPKHRALPFVVKAFNNLRDVFLTRAESANFNIPSYFGTLIPKKSHESFDTLYHEYITNLKTTYSVPGAIDTKQHLLRYVLENIKTFPITQSGFALSRHCPISTTGLAIEISDIKYTSDLPKGALLGSDTYKCFLEDAMATGFYVDKNNPWRLIANLDSIPIKNLLLEYKEDTKPEYVMARFFTKKTQYEDLECVYRFFNKSLTADELFEYTIKIRMAETDMDPSLEPRILKETKEIYNLYSGNYPSNPLKGPSAIIAKYCAEKTRDTYLTRASINSYAKTTLKDFF